MSKYIAKKISKKLLGETRANGFGTKDEYDAYTPTERQGRKVQNKGREAIPPGLSANDTKVLKKVRRRARLFDTGLFNCCGIRFGWSSLVAIIPGAGDVLDAFMAMMVVHTCQKVDGGLPAELLGRMYINIVLDFVIGLVPFIGDIADALYHANTRNSAILEKHLREKGKKNLRNQGLPVPEVDPSDPEVFDRVQAESDRPGFTTAQPGRQPQMSTNGHAQQSSGVTAPPAARVHKDHVRTEDGSAGGGGGGGLFGGFGRKQNRPADIEMGTTNPNTSGAQKSRRK